MEEERKKENMEKLRKDMEKSRGETVVLSTGLKDKPVDESLELDEEDEVIELDGMVSEDDFIDEDNDEDEEVGRFMF